MKTRSRFTRPTTLVTLATLFLLAGCAGQSEPPATAVARPADGAAADGAMPVAHPAEGAGAATAAGATATATAPASATSANAPAGWQSFGGAVSNGDVITARQLLAAAESYNGRALIVEGEIVEVCQNKGCWMTMRDGDREMRVRFKDYAFFVPKDAGGKTARIEGIFKIEEVPVDEARHYLEDAGKHEEAMKITAPVESYTFMASGVLIGP